ncbi:rod shape-determining protein MreD [Candidatus Thiosymbion oneisti]|uniref:rod shape-determining protein MreD n=1 Tax=Candidatus Thiosymbion oneisti TaxID=589554 RepID=UPI001061C1D6|nr:rod shape-determining protein MreD [Candidatus Thiosymbion oneisti]
MSESPRKGSGVILITLGTALVLTILPLPQWADGFRPQWMALTLIYWTLTLPTRVGIFWAWGAGLMLDAATGTALGQHALSLSVPIYLMLELHRRIRLFPPLQQTLSVWVLLLVERLLFLWIHGATGQPTPTLAYWIPPFVGMLLWPWVFILLRNLSRRFAIT